MSATKITTRPSTTAKVSSHITVHVRTSPRPSTRPYIALALRANARTYAEDENSARTTDNTSMSVDCCVEPTTASTTRCATFSHSGGRYVPMKSAVSFCTCSSLRASTNVAMEYTPNTMGSAVSTVKNVSVAARSIIAFIKNSWRTRRATNPHARRDKCRAVSPAEPYSWGTSVRTSSPLLGAATAGLGRAPFFSPSPGVAFCVIPAAYRAYSARADTSRKLIRVSRLIARQYPP